MTDAAVPLSVRGIRKTYGAVTALDGLSFEVKRGEIFGLLGPNGAGKTTAMHIIMGVLLPTEGEVSLLGFSPFKERDKIYPRINFSSAYTQLPGNLSLETNLRIFADLYDVPRPKEKIERLVEVFKLTPRLKQKAAVLSSGEQTRLNLCKALLNDPEILFLDEPTASLDPDIADLVRAALREFQRDRGLTIVYTSHNMAEVEDLCDRVLFVHRGKKVIEGSPKAVRDHFQKESLEKVFIHLARSGDLKAQGEEE
jgi:ABC-2 type transport system ATP-binding protein